MDKLIACLLIPVTLAFANDCPAKEPPTLLDRLEQTLKSDDKPFSLVTQIYIKPESGPQFEAAAAPAAKLSAAEKGCLAYDFQRDLEKPGHYTLVEKWIGLVPLRQHLTREHTKQIQAVFERLSTTPRTTDIYAPIVAD